MHINLLIHLLYNHFDTKHCENLTDNGRSVGTTNIEPKPPKDQVPSLVALIINTISSHNYSIDIDILE